MQVDIIYKEIKYKATKSSGPGGQHVNKTSTKVEASFDILKSIGLSETEKERLKIKLASKLNSDYILILTSSQTRSQLKNKKIVTQKLINILEEHLQVAKARKKTKPSKSSIEKRLQSKKRKAQKKVSRKKPDFE
ncbi:MAG: alternative ribosome rescue aminoacyl-tRNA hydrolase ArfB [Flavobacteriales bacterium]